MSRHQRLLPGRQAPRNIDFILIYPEISSTTMNAARTLIVRWVFRRLACTSIFTPRIGQGMVSFVGLLKRPGTSMVTPLVCSCLTFNLATLPSLSFSWRNQNQVLGLARRNMSDLSSRTAVVDGYKVVGLPNLTVSGITTIFPVLSYIHYFNTYANVAILM